MRYWVDNDFEYPDLGESTMLEDLANEGYIKEEPTCPLAGTYNVVTDGESVTVTCTKCTPSSN